MGKCTALWAFPSPDLGQTSPTPVSGAAGPLRTQLTCGEGDRPRDSLPRVTSFPRTMMRPLVKATSSRICIIPSQPARLTAGPMNLEQMSRSLRSFLFMATSLMGAFSLRNQ